MEYSFLKIKFISISNKYFYKFIDYLQNAFTVRDLYIVINNYENTNDALILNIVVNGYDAINKIVELVNNDINPLVKRDNECIDFILPYNINDVKRLIYETYGVLIDSNIKSYS